MIQDGSKIDPRWFQDDGFNMDPSIVQDGSIRELRWFQDDGSKMDSSGVQDGTKMVPR